MQVYPGDDESACKEVSLKRSGTTVLLDIILNELFHHLDPARHFQHRREANWYMFSFSSLGKGSKKIDFFLGKSPKLWVGGGQES